MLRAEWFTSTDDQRFLSVEVKSSATDAADRAHRHLGQRARTPRPDSGGTATMSRFTDAGQYMYHRFNSPLARSTDGADQGHDHQQPGRHRHGAGDQVAGRAEARRRASTTSPTSSTTTWTRPRSPTGSSRWPRSSRRSPEIVDLPNKTNGYRRAAQAQFGTAAASTFYVTSKAYGSRGRQRRSPWRWSTRSGATSPLTVAVTGKDVVVNLATDGAGRDHQHRRARWSTRSTRRRRRPPW